LGVLRTHDLAGAQQKCRSVRKTGLRSFVAWSEPFLRRNDMSDVVRAPIRFADRLVSATQSVAKTFGFLHDGRESVVVARDADSLRITLPDLDDEGWPSVSTRIPSRFEFYQATSSVLTRAATFSAPGSIDDARQWFADLGIKLPEPPAGANLGDGAHLRLRRSENHVFVALLQRRDESGLERAMQNRGSGSDQSS
jgi:hypothetical protein